MQNIILIGGIHGVGKNFMLKRTKFLNPINHLTASEVLKWSEVSKNPHDKKVVSISNTQDLLLHNLKKIVKENETYLLDGHLTLLNKAGEVERIPQETIIQINPKALIVKTAHPAIILKRLEERDNTLWDLDKIIHMQQEELAYAKEMSSLLGINLYILEDDQEDKLGKINNFELENHLKTKNETPKYKNTLINHSILKAISGKCKQ